MQFHYVCREGGMTAMNRFYLEIFVYKDYLKFEIHSSLITIKAP